MVGAAAHEQLERIGLEQGETVDVRVETPEALIALTDRRLVVVDDHRVILHAPIAALRRIELDVERAAPATLVVVADHPVNAAQIIEIPPESYDAAAEVVLRVGRRLALQN